MQMPGVMAAGTERLDKSDLERRIEGALAASGGKFRRQLFLQGILKVVPHLHWRRDETRLKQMALAAAVEGINANQD